MSNRSTTQGLRRWRAFWMDTVAEFERAIDNDWDDGAAVNVLLTPGAAGPRAGDRLLQWITGGGAARWEAGQNRFARAMPAAFETGPTIYRATHR